MSAAEKLKPISPEAYLAQELVSSIKHEFVDGKVFAMAGGRILHGLIASNLLAALHSRLRGKPCRVYNSDIKIRIRWGNNQRFYYPDVSVVCRSNPAQEVFQDEPVLIAEVLSAKTRRIDTGEKQDAYLTIPTLAVYLLVEPETRAVTAYRRTGEEFHREDYEGPAAVLPLPEWNIELPLAEIYEGAEPSPEPEEDE